MGVFLGLEEFEAVSLPDSPTGHNRKITTGHPADSVAPVPRIPPSAWHINCLAAPAETAREIRRLLRRHETL
jgi:hypothetical protein